MDFEAALKKFGLESFRPGQREVIEHVLSGGDSLCVMPTGGGKSLCYQLPAVLRPGLTIVVSPLIALMKDQVDTLIRRGISATLINSTLTGAEQNERLNEVAAGRYALVYVAPERLRNQRFMESIRATPIQLLAIDEAHCISEWGHDFRPDYARIGQFREALGGVQTIALTATATPRVRQDICDVLQLQHPKQFVTGFARSNLHIGSVFCHSDRDKDRVLFDFLRSDPGAGIIYAATRKRCEALVDTIGKELKISLGAYHAGLTLDQRRFIQEQFMSGKLQGIVATNAFGMGIDKADLRYVVHYNIPGSMEAYYQEAGRAGRDGFPSQCVLLYSPSDRFIQEFFVENANPPPELIEKVYEGLCELTEDPIERTALELKEMFDVPQSAEAVGTALQILSRTGVIERLEVSGGLAMFRLSSQLPTLIDMLPKEAEVKRKVLRAVERAIGDRRDEPVYIHPRWLMQQTEMERDALGRVLSELRKLEPFDYVPPFRGRAIHFRRRGVPFDQLKIDFRALEERKRADFEKLDQVVAFAQSKRCRQLAILQYFGDPAASVCGLCDRCQGFAGWPKLAAPPDQPVGLPKQDGEAIVAQPSPKGKLAEATHEEKSLLQNLLKAIDQFHGRLGKLLIVDFLCGSENAKVQRLRLNRLRGYGMLGQTKKKAVGSLMDTMLWAGLIEQHSVAENRPTVSVSELGKAILSGQDAVPEKVASKLRELRLPNLPSTSSIPLPPSTLGPSPIPELPRTAISSLAVEPQDWRWTVRLVEDHYSLAEIAAIRRKSIDEILDDLTNAAKAGVSFSTLTLVEPAIQQALSQVRVDPPSAATQPIFRERPALWRLAQALIG